MSQTGESKPSWRPLFGCCAVLVLLVSVGVWGFRTVRQRQLLTAQEVRTAVLQPYWDALPRADFAEVCQQLCTSERNQKADPALVAQRFADFIQSHGALESVEVVSTTRGGVIGEAGETMRVLVHMNFAKDSFLILTYNLFRQDQQPWRIDSVTTKDRQLAMPTF